jgi:competence protein ComGC
MKCVSSRNVRALTLLEVLFVIAVLVVLAVLLLPALSGGRNYSGPNCATNLKQVGLAFRFWAEDHDGKFPMQVSVTNGGSMEFLGTRETFRHFQVMSNELGTPRILFCRSDTKRSSAANFGPDLNNARISYFVGVDACSNQILMPLVGDRNLTLRDADLPPGLHSLGGNDMIGWNSQLHKRCGNVLLVDCSVQHVTSTSLPGLFQISGAATNRLSIP